MRTLIFDEELIKEFSKILPKLREDEVLVMQLLARRKYEARITRHESMLERVLLKRTDPDYILRRVKKIGRAEGLYRDIRSNKIIPLESMVIYLDLIPRTCIRASNQFITDINQWYYQAIVDRNFDFGLFRRIDAKLFSAISKSVSRKPIVMIDIDVNNFDKLIEVYNVVKGWVYWVSKTHGGYHIICDSEITREIYINFKELIESKVIEIFTKQAPTPVPGTIQGGKRVLKIDFKNI